MPGRRSCSTRRSSERRRFSPVTVTIEETGRRERLPSSDAPPQPILALWGLEKRYAGTRALKPTDLAFEAGEVHAIVGENGAGKSTLIKLLTGVITPTSGQIFWRGEPVSLSTPHEAIER